MIHKNNTDWPTRKPPIGEIIIYVICIFIIIALFASFYLFMLKPSHERLSELNQSIKSHNMHISSRRIQVYPIGNDPNVDILMLQSWMNETEREYMDFITDVRQETMSRLEYINAWLSVWIAILAIICGIIPALLQYRLYIINKKHLKEELKEFEHTATMHEISNYVNGVISCTESQLASDSAMRDKLNCLFLNCSIDNTIKLIDMIICENKKTIPIKSQYAIFLSLTLLMALFDRLKIFVDSKHLKSFESFYEKLKDIIENIVNETNNKSLHEVVSNLRIDLQAFRSQGFFDVSPASDSNDDLLF